MNKNCFEEIFKLLEEFKVSEIPADRLFYLNSIKQLIEMGGRLNKLSPNDETQKRVVELKGQIENYTLYPKLNNLVK